MICSDPGQIVDYTLKCIINLETDTNDPNIRIQFDDNESIFLSPSINF